MLSSKSLSLHTMSQTTHAVQAWTLCTNALENFIWLRHCPKIRLGWWNCKRTQEELSGSIQGANTSTRSKGKQGSSVLGPDGRGRIRECWNHRSSSDLRTDWAPAFCEPDSHSQVRGFWPPTDHQIIFHRPPKPQSRLNSFLNIGKDHTVHDSPPNPTQAQRNALSVTAKWQHYLR